MDKVINSKKIRVGIVGCGRISKNHFNAINIHHDKYKLIALCDTDKKNLQKAKNEHGGTPYTSIDDMLANEILDLVVLCTPSGLHPKQTIKSAQAGVNILTEKPMATRWKDGLKMVSACDDAGVQLFVVKQNRMNSTLQLLKRAVDEKRFGRMYMVQLNVFWTRPQAYYDSAQWRGTWELDGGAFMNQASHYVDLISWLIGPVESIQAMMGTLDRDIQVEDTGVLNIKWRNGALGSMSVTMLTYPQNLEGSITLLGEKGSVRVGGSALNEILHWDFADTRPYDADIEKVNYKTDSVYGHGHIKYYQNVSNTLLNRASIETCGREGLKSLELLIAAYLSARDGKMFSLPLEY